MMLSNGMVVVYIPNFSAYLSEEKRNRWVTWIEALKSGKYIQVKGALRVPEGFCCLGVACDLVKTDTLRWTDGTGCNQLFGINGIELQSAHLPRAVSRLYGLEPWGVSILATGSRGKTTQVDLARLNDEGVTFAEIASILEKAITGGYEPGVS
jgi:hypothetical protein